MDKGAVRVVLLLIALLLVFFVSQRQPNLRDELVSAIDDSGAYRISTEITVKTLGEFNGNTINQTDEIKAVGATDPIGRKMMMSAVTQDVEGKPETVTMYLIGNTLYMKTKGQWTIKELSADYGVWEKHYQLKQMARIIRKSKVREISRDSDIIAVEIKTDKKTILNYIKEQFTLDAYSPNKASVIEQSLKDVTMSALLDSTTLLPTEFRMQTVLELDGVTRSTTTVMKMWDYGKQIEVTLPEGLAEMKATTVSA